MTMTDDLQTCDRCEGVPFTSAASYCPWCGAWQGRFLPFEEPMGPMTAPTDEPTPRVSLPVAEQLAEEPEKARSLHEAMLDEAGTGKADRGLAAAGDTGALARLFRTARKRTVQIAHPSQEVRESIAQLERGGLPVEAETEIESEAARRASRCPMCGEDFDPEEHDEDPDGHLCDPCAEEWEETVGEPLESVPDAAEFAPDGRADE